ncbi:MAG: molecular chaperone HscC [Lachnospiraceae bacterium]|nr:molecular chaperone HscC [Lachnospiraceae bacterium]
MMILGIDLGTTNSLVAYYSETGPKIIPNRLGENLTPSVVSVDEEGNVFIGKTALERKALHPMDTAEVFKRSMGTAKEYVLAGKKYTSEELSSFILRSLKEDAEVFLGQTVEEAVISVPAYFNDAQRRATKRAGELAGLKVERMISEPTAAAISYGLHEKAEKTRFLVFDLGGGTFDVSILEKYKSVMQVRAVAGDNFLGGEDFTTILYHIFLNKVKLEEKDLDTKTLLHIRRQAEIAKKEFTDGREVTMKAKVGEEVKECRITEDEYEKNCQLLLAQLRRPIERSLKDANIRLSEISEVVLVGGATKMSIVRKFVTKLFGRFPNVSLNPDEVVALGAAIQGAMKERNEAIREIVMTDVCPFTLGTDVVVGREGGYMEAGHFFPIIERNTVIPVSRTERLYTASDMQRCIRVEILQGESRFSKNNMKLGEVEVPVPRKKAGEEAIDITYTYDINSILEVVVKVVSTGETKRIVLKKDDVTMTDEEIDARFEELASLKIHPREEEENKLLLFRGERLYEESIGDVRRLIDHELQRFEEVLDKQDRTKIDKARDEFREFLDGIEDQKWDGE